MPRIKHAESPLETKDNKTVVLPPCERQSPPATSATPKKAGKKETPDCLLTPEKKEEKRQAKIAEAKKRVRLLVLSIGYTEVKPGTYEKAGERNTYGVVIKDKGMLAYIRKSEKDEEGNEFKIVYRKGKWEDITVSENLIQGTEMVY